jgi:hypothetical protein
MLSERRFLRDENPLFLPDLEPSTGEEAPSSTPIPSTTDGSGGPPPQNETNEGETVVSGMMTLTSLLQNSSLYRIDSDSDGEEAGVFMGDPEASRDIF